MRILCLHDQCSSASKFHNDLKELEERLYTRHEIELVFVDSPLVIAGNMNTRITEEQQDIQDAEIHFSSEIAQYQKRVWVHKDDDSPRLLGLDASILHLRQIWYRYILTNPFCGIIGLGQGAALAAMLPLLQHQGTPSADDAIIPDDDHGDRMMFKGLNFCIFIHGWDLLASVDFCSTGEEYDEAKVIQSMHILREEDNMGLTLLKRFGGADNERARFHFHESDCASKAIKDKKVLNLMGKFIVARKKEFLSSRREYCKVKLNEEETRFHERGLITKTTKTSDALDFKSERNLAELVQSTRLELANLENHALSLINSIIAKEPPKALMAVIAPNAQDGGSIVGGWTGEKDAFRSKAFKEAGGAPCPKEFVLRREDRPKKYEAEIKTVR